MSPILGAASEEEVHGDTRGDHCDTDERCGTIADHLIDDHRKARQHEDSGGARSWPLAASAVPFGSQQSAGQIVVCSGQWGDYRDRAFGRVGNSCTVAEIGSPRVLQQLS